MATTLAAPLTEAALNRDIFPLFSRALEAERRRGEVYLANHSLGRPPDRAAEDVAGALALWYERMDGAWGAWLEEAAAFQRSTGELIGLAEGGAVVLKSSAGQGLRAVLNAFPIDQPIRVVTTSLEFDSVDFILKSYAEAGRAVVEWIEPTAREGEVPKMEAQPVVEAIRRGCDLVVLSQVFFMTGQVMPDLAAILREARAAGALSLVDAYHAAGAIPVDMWELGCDFMVGGSYKYTRGGPGACWLALSPGALARDDLRTLDTGWFAKKNPMGFERGPSLERGEGGAAWQESTPTALAPYQAKAGLELTLAMGDARLRAYSLERQALLRDLLRSRGVEPFEPTNPNEFAAFSLVAHDDPQPFVQRLRTAGVNVDARGRFVRFCPDVLNTQEDLERAADAVAREMG